MTNENASAINDLITILKQKKAILMVGAGSSKFMGYPLWEELLNELKNEFAQDLISTENFQEFANKIKTRVIERKRLSEYHKFLSRKFGPKSNGRTHDDFHINLVNLGFKGVVTTNYDVVIESAISDSENNDKFCSICEPVDLCDKKSYPVSDFLRSLSNPSNINKVLHLHGYYKEPERIILTENDYQIKYGNFDTSGKSQHAPLDTLHRKVIWSILATQSVVFVGFRMTDPFFMPMLKIVQNDLDLQGDKIHFAILPNTDQQEADLLIQQYCVQPIFYDVIEGDHSNLKQVIFDIASNIGVAVGSTKISAITKKMLER